MVSTNPKCDKIISSIFKLNYSIEALNPSPLWNLIIQGFNYFSRNVQDLGSSYLLPLN